MAGSYVRNGTLMILLLDAAGLCKPLGGSQPSCGMDGVPQGRDRYNMRQSGKTTISNFISDSMNAEEFVTPRPTQGVRIVEFELTGINVTGKQCDVDIELWDCSGDHRFECCWPTMAVGAHGVIIVCSPSNVHAATREMDLLYSYFVSQAKLSAKQSVLLYNCTEEQDDISSLNLSSTFSKVSQVKVNLKSGGNRLKIDFSNFVSSVLQSISNNEVES